MLRFPAQRVKGLAAVLGVVVGVTALLGARDATIDPREGDRITAFLVAELIKREHLSKPEIDDEVSRRWHAEFIESLDPLKLYFTRADIEEFEPFRTELDDQIRRSDLSFMVRVFDRYLERRDERFRTINALLDEGFDFTVEETYVTDPDRFDYPADEAEARDRWRKELKRRLLIRIGGETEYEEAVRRLRIHYRDEQRLFRQLETYEVSEVYLTALARSIDPHSEYFHWKNLEDMTQSLHLSLEGIGATLMIEDGVPKVVQIVPGGAADKDGRLKPEDKILGVEKEDGEVEDFVEKKLSDVVRKIRGPRGTEVRLVVQPAGTSDRKVYEITREKIELADQRARSEILETTGEDGRALRVGLIDIPSFYGNTDALDRGDPEATSVTTDVRGLLEEFRDEGVDCVLIDLRNNPGGLLLEAISLSGLFIDTGPVVRVRDVDGIFPYDDEDEGTAWDGPLAVLINHTSASASEIFAGVIKDYGRGLIVGDSSTYGKGTVQSIMGLDRLVRHPEAFDPPLGALKLTIQQFYRANGMSTQVRGVAPDVHIPSLLDHIKELGEGDEDNAVGFDEIEPLEHDFYGRVPQDLVSRLAERSLARRAADEDFQKQGEAIKRFIEQQEKQEISLVKEEFLAETTDDAVDELIEQPAALDGPAHDEEDDDSVWDDDSFYNEEVLRIVADYLTLGSKVVASAPTRVAPGTRN